MFASFNACERTIRVWSAPIESPSSVAAQFYGCLSHEEQLRAARFRFEHLQKAFILSRGVLRTLLGRYLDTAPGKLRFVYGPHGKPALVEASWLNFNVSHSGGLGLFAITRDCEIGVDLERVRPLPDIYEVAKQFFCSDETSQLMSLPISEREASFFRCWTRKEAYIKAAGTGLSVPLDSFQVTFAPGEDVRFVHLDHDRVAAQSWTLADLRLRDPYVGALAYHGAVRAIQVTCLADLSELETISCHGND